MKRINAVTILSITAFIFMPCALSQAANAAKTNTPPAASAPVKTKSSKEATPKKDAKLSASAVTSASLLGSGEDILGGAVGKGSGLSPLLTESFQTDLATGSATANIPIVVPPGRKNMQPSLALSYSSNNPDGVVGVGWGLTTSSIQHSTKKGVPKYDNTDTFVFASSGSSGELVLVNTAAGEYRQKIETGFMKYVYDSVGFKWTVWDKSGTKYTFGSSVDSRLVDSAQAKIFAWFLDRVEDVYGNAVLFTYEKDGGQVYMSKVEYTANASVTPALTADKRVEFIYEGRPDIQHNYRSGWDVQTAKRLKDILVKVDGALVWCYSVGYELSADTNRSLLNQITLFDGAGNSLPPKKFKYQTIE